MSNPPTPEDEAENRTAAVVALLAECVTSHETNALSRVALRAKFLWRCHPCRRDHYLTTDTCSCRAKRPADLPG
ncbi:hypothetical protein ABZ593_21170 [Streptomyces sp. NPDC012617]|uniref:hypothetical protein n=1 Tax=Streptomyces TaxID=1883 RepID=UPI0033D1E02F